MNIATYAYHQKRNVALTLNMKFKLKITEAFFLNRRNLKLRRLFGKFRRIHEFFFFVIRVKTCQMLLRIR